MDAHAPSLDDDARAVLRNCRCDGAHVLVIERVLAGQDEDPEGKFTDLTASGLHVIEAAAA